VTGTHLQEGEWSLMIPSRASPRAALPGSQGSPAPGAPCRHAPRTAASSQEDVAIVRVRLETHQVLGFAAEGSLLLAAVGLAPLGHEVDVALLQPPEARHAINRADEEVELYSSQQGLS
jgi:hypothetical protein